MWCSVLQCMNVAMCCSALQYITVCLSSSTQCLLGEYCAHLTQSPPPPKIKTAHACVLGSCSCYSSLLDGISLAIFRNSKEPCVSRKEPCISPKKPASNLCLQNESDTFKRALRVVLISCRGVLQCGAVRCSVL